MVSKEELKNFLRELKNKLDKFQKSIIRETTYKKFLS